MATSAQGTDTFVYDHWEGMNSPELMGILKGVRLDEGFDTHTQTTDYPL